MLHPRFAERFVEAAILGARKVSTMRLAALIAFLAGVFPGPTATAPACAHPHVFARIQIEVRYGADGLPSAIHQTWIFDEMFSAFQTSGLGSGKAAPTREQLAPVAARFMDSMKADDYFTRVNVGGQDVKPGAPQDVHLDLTDGVLRLQFQLPLPATPQGELSITIYDPVYYLALTFADDDAARLTAAPAACKITSSKAQAPKAVDESFFQSLKPDQDWARQFASTLTIDCR